MSRSPLFFSFLFIIALFLQTGCSPGENGETPSEEEAGETVPAPLEISDEEIHSGDGTLLVAIGGIPSDIRVDEETSFGAAERFSDASLSPDQKFLAVVTSGVSHSGGWLYDTDREQAVPAAFQYGGGLSAGPWSEDSRWAVFVHKGPAGDRTLSVADRESSGDTVENRSMAVQIPDHNNYPPEERIYEHEEWSAKQLYFEVDGERWIFDPETGETGSAE